MTNHVQKLRDIARDGEKDVGELLADYVEDLVDAADAMSSYLRLANIYFDIAAEQIGESEVRRIRDKRLPQRSPSGG